MLTRRREGPDGAATSKNLISMPARICDYPKIVTLQLLRAYKWAVSPMFLPACRYIPTCSEYAMEAVERFGAVRGGLMACARLLRCHPFARGGYDPVVKPQKCCAHAASEPFSCSPRSYHGVIRGSL
jgi:uncharacterized protein